MPKIPPATTTLVVLLVEPNVLLTLVNKTDPVVPLLIVGKPLLPLINPESVSV